MNSSDTIKKFLQYEVTHNLLDFTVNGCRIWAYMRFDVYMKIEELLNNQNKRTFQGNHIRCSEIFDLVLNCTINHPFIKAAQKDYLIFTHPRRTLIDGEYKCLYTDELTNKLGNKAISGEFIDGFSHFKPVKTRNLLYMDYMEVSLYLQKKIQFKYIKDKEIITNKFRIIRDDIRDIFGVDISEEFLVDRAKMKFIIYNLKRRKIKRLVQRIKPKVIIEVVSYDLNMMILNEVSCELGIPTVELQHGVMGRGHIAYNYLNECDYSYLPQYVFLFSDYWKKTAGFAQKNERLITVGYPYLEMLMMKYPKCESVKKDFLTILVLSQPEFSIKILREIDKLVSLLDDSRIPYKLFYKLHPREYKLDNRMFDKINNGKNVEIISSPNKSLYELFSISDIQIGVTSTAIFEGLSYKLKTFILHFEKTDLYMGDLCNNGYAVMCESYYDLYKNIEVYFKNGKSQNNIDSSLFFVPNAIDNIINELSIIMNNSFDTIKNQDR